MNFNQSNLRSRRTAYTLIELLISSATASLLLSGLGASIYVADKAMNLEDREGFSVTRKNLNRGRSAREIDRLLNDLRHAHAFSEHTSNAVTFTAPDRDWDRTPETIRYAWSGVAGEPLTYQYNHGAVVPLIENVQDLDFSFLRRLIVAPEEP